MSDHFKHSLMMDRIYRYQRYIYDFTRKYYLLGRDTLLEEMDIQAGDCILEMGCGTARNLIHLAGRYPDIFLYGIDASQEMLKTAEGKVRRYGYESRISLCASLAENVNYHNTFSLKNPFDKIFFSYSLSMIPTWRDAIDNAIENVKPDGCIYIVDFWDQADWPAWFQAVLQGWLRFFHVRHEPELLDYIQKKQNIDQNALKIDSIFGRYALKTKLKLVS